MPFHKAKKHEAKLRLALDGPSGSGKTYSALAIAAGLGGKVAVIDTERGSASKYADLFDFDVLELDSFHPDRYIAAIGEAAKAGYSVVIIDSLSHAWMGKDGALELVDREAQRSQSKNTYVAWREVTPIQNRLIDTILQAPLHVIATMRSKTAYVVEADAKGKQAPRKVGLEPIQRDGVEYEFDVVGRMDLENALIIQKSRCSALTNGIFPKPGKDVADILLGWLSGDPMPPTVLPPKPVNLERNVKQLFVALKNAGLKELDLRLYLDVRFDAPIASTKDLTPEQFDTVLAEIQDGTLAAFRAN